MSFIEDENHSAIIDSKIALDFHQVIKFLDGGDDDLIIVFIQITLQPGGAIRAIHTVRREALIFFHDLIVEVLPIHHEKDLVDEIQFGRHAICLKAGKRFTRASGMPNIATTFWPTPALSFIGAVDLLQDTLSSCNLVMAHNERSVADIKY